MIDIEFLDVPENLERDRSYSFKIKISTWYLPRLCTGGFVQVVHSDDKYENFDIGKGAYIVSPIGEEFTINTKAGSKEGYEVIKTVLPAHISDFILFTIPLFIKLGLSYLTAEKKIKVI